MTWSVSTLPWRDDDDRYLSVTPEQRCAWVRTVENT